MRRAGAIYPAASALGKVFPQCFSELFFFQGDPGASLMAVSSKSLFKAMKAKPVHPGQPLPMDLPEQVAPQTQAAGG